MTRLKLEIRKTFVAHATVELTDDLLDQLLHDPTELGEIGDRAGWRLEDVTGTFPLWRETLPA